MNFFRKISSKYTYYTIASYIKDENILLKLAFYSKTLQNKIDIEIYDYQLQFFKSKINLEDYLYYNRYENEFNKDRLKIKLREDLEKNKIDENSFLKFAVYFFKKNQKKTPFAQNIDLYSPFFDALSKTDFFGKNFIIPISVIEIEKYNLLNDYILKFDALNKLNSKYSLDFSYKDARNINYFKIFKINFAKIEKLQINNIYSDKENNFDYFFSTLFSFDFIGNYLTLLMPSKSIINTNIFAKINNLNTLKYLELNSFKFNTPLIIKMNNLEELILLFSENIAFEENSLINLKSLIISNCSLQKPLKKKNLLKCPNLKKCCLKKSKGIEYDLIFDLGSFKKLEFFNGDSNYFLKLDNIELLEELSLIPSESNDIQKEINLLEKIFSIKTLKKIDFMLNKINNDQISKIHMKNNSIEEMKIKCCYPDGICTLESLQTKFPNITKIIISIVNYNYNYITKFAHSLLIVEDSISKISKFELNLDRFNVAKFICASYEKLESVIFNFDEEITNLKESFPIFNEKCSKQFPSLLKFSLTITKGRFNKEILINIFNNIDKMPNICEFIIYCYSTISFKNDFQIDSTIFSVLIKKILSMKSIKRIEICIRDGHAIQEEYSINELKQEFPKINFSKFNRIKIEKLNN